MKLKIGLELHIQLNLDTKLFSVSKNRINDEINTNVNSIDVGTPGSMPSLNKKAVKLGIRLALLLKSKLTDKLFFDRKNYFYHDSPKGFQITQFYKPLSSGGSFSFLLKNNKFKTINIKSIILEEDTANSKKEKEGLFVDYNRAGIALIELVTEPDFSSTEEVKYFLESIFKLLKNSDISKCKFSSGNVRVDINISVYTSDNKTTNRVEIKNLNKFENIINSIDQEFEIQKEFLDNKIENELVTKRFDEKTKKIILMRKKMTEEEYLFIPETNILPINLSQKMILKEENFIKKNPFFLEENLINKFKFNYQEKILLLKNKCLLELFINLFPNKYKNKDKLIDYFKNISFLFNDEICLTSNIIIKILNKNLNIKQMIDVTKKYLKDSCFDIEVYLKKLEDFKFIYSEKDLESFCLYLVQTDLELLKKYKINPKSTEKYIMGQIMKWSHKKIDPFITLKIIKNYFDNLIK